MSVYLDEVRAGTQIDACLASCIRLLVRTSDRRLISSISSSGRPGSCAKLQLTNMQRAKSAIIRSVLGGTEEIVCHRGTHQYGDSSGGVTGVSACGLAALNFARVIFEKERESRSRQDEDFIQAVITRETVHVGDLHLLSHPSKRL